MKKLLLFLLLMGIGQAYSQSIYEIKYSFNKLDNDGNETSEAGKEYSGMFFYFPSQDTNVMRVRYLDDQSGKYLVVEQKMVTKLVTKNDKQYWELVGTNPVFVSTVGPDQHYYPDRIVLEKNPEDKYYKPSFVASDDNPASNAKTHYGKIISFDVLTKEQVSNDHLGLYSWHWPDSQQQPDQNKSQQNTGPYDFAHATMYLVQVTNSLDKRLGPGFYANHQNIKDIFSDAAASCGIGFRSIEILGNDFNKQNVLNAVANLNPGPNDIVIFYYSGHGYRNEGQESQWPRMVLTDSVCTIDYLNDNSLSLNDDVYQPLSRKGAHLLMVFGECCNTEPETTPTLSDPVKLSSSYYFPDAASIKNLLKQTGTMLLATSKPTESTWYYSGAGGFFGTTLIDNITKATSLMNTGSSVNWKDIIDNTSHETVTKSIADEPITAEQNPIYTIDIH